MDLEKELEQLKNSLLQAERIQTELDRRVYYMKTLYDVSKDIFGSVEYEPILKNFLLMTMGNFGIAEGFILTVDVPSREINGFVSLGFQGDDISILRTGGSEILLSLDPVTSIQKKADLKSHGLLPPSIIYAFPFTVDKDCNGIMGLGDKLVSQTYNTDDGELLDTLVNNLVMALKNARSFEETKNLNQELQKKNIQLETALNELKAYMRKIEIKDNRIRMLNLYQTVSSSLAYIGDLQELLTTIVSIVTSELHCEESSVLLYDEENNEFEFFTAAGEMGMGLVTTRFPADKGIAGRALRERATQVVNDVQSDPDFYGNIDEDHDFKTRSIISAPLISGDEKVGVINAINKMETNFFDKEDDQVLSAIADEVALAVKHARLFEYVVDSYCKIRQGINSCKGCKRPLKSWTPCVRQLELSGL
jgi:GAF domain-containing protein